MSLPNDLDIGELTDGGAKFVANDGSNSAVLVTADKSYAVSKISTSNSLLVVPPSSAASPAAPDNFTCTVVPQFYYDLQRNTSGDYITLMRMLGKSVDFEEVRSEKSLALIDCSLIRSSFLELNYPFFSNPCFPFFPTHSLTHPLPQYIDDEKKVTLDRLCEALGRSEGEVKAMLNDVGAVDLPETGWCVVLQEKFIEGCEGILESISQQVSDKDFLTGKVDVAKVLKGYSGELALHRDYLEILLRSEFGGEGADDFNVKKISLSVDKIARYSGLQALLSVDKKKANAVDSRLFMEMWRALLPHQLPSDYAIEFDMLQGTAVKIVTNEDEYNVAYLNRADVLGLPLEGRVNRMLDTKSSWTSEEAKIYVGDLGDTDCVMEKGGAIKTLRPTSSGSGIIWTGKVP